jgi:hypothetical protein
MFMPYSRQGFFSPPDLGALFCCRAREKDVIPNLFARLWSS